MEYNKQDLADLLHYVDGCNTSCVKLPTPSKRKNSNDDKGKYSDTWYDEFYRYYANNANAFYEIEIDGAWLVGTNINISGVNTSLVILSYDSGSFDQCVLSDDLITDAKDLITIWLGNTTIDEHEYHCINEFAKKVGY